MNAAQPRRGSPIRGISAVLPARDEQGNLARVVESTLEALGDAVPSFEIIIVDDGSRDATGRIADELAAGNPSIRVIHHAGPLGYGSALRSGMAVATLPYTLFVDADRQFNPLELERLIQWDDRHDLVLGYRLRRNDSFIRRVLGFFFKVMVRLLFAVKCRDVNCGFKLIRTSQLADMSLDSRGVLINTEILYRARQQGADMREVGVHHYARRAGKSSAVTLGSTLRAVAEAIRLWKRINRERRAAHELAHSTVATESSESHGSVLREPMEPAEIGAPEPAAPVATTESLLTDRERSETSS
jgi:hypothetical protein